MESNIRSKNHNELELMAGAKFFPGGVNVFDDYVHTEAHDDKIDAMMYFVNKLSEGMQTCLTSRRSKLLLCTSLGI